MHGTRQPIDAVWGEDEAAGSGGSGADKLSDEGRAAAKWGLG